MIHFIYAQCNVFDHPYIEAGFYFLFIYYNINKVCSAIRSTYKSKSENSNTFLHQNHCVHVFFPSNFHRFALNFLNVNGEDVYLIEGINRMGRKWIVRVFPQKHTTRQPTKIAMGHNFSECDKIKCRCSHL